MRSLIIYLKTCFPCVAESCPNIIGWLSASSFACGYMPPDFILLKHIIGCYPFLSTLFDSYFLKKCVYVGFPNKWKIAFLTSSIFPTICIFSSFLFKVKLIWSNYFERNFVWNYLIDNFHIHFYYLVPIILNIISNFFRLAQFFQIDRVLPNHYGLC